MKTCVVIYNPLSGKKAEFKVMPQFEKILTSYGYNNKIIYTGDIIDIGGDEKYIPLCHKCWILGEI